MKTFKIPIVASLVIILIAGSVGMLANSYIQLILLFLFVNSIMGMSLNLQDNSP
ncbi:MAG: hypothetical protein L6Q37_10415 [Bdellovibrionaceae bacterium]|nr:hypothetical protein [Pseudobdellovibrionaceae bacterium]